MIIAVTLHSSLFSLLIILSEENYLYNLRVCKDWLLILMILNYQTIFTFVTRQVIEKQTNIFVSKAN